MSLEDIEALIRILEATFGDPDEVGTASAELDCLIQGNCEFSIYYAEFQRMMAILDYDAKAKKAALNQGLSQELQASLVYQTNKPEDFNKICELCIKLDFRIRVSRLEIPLLLTFIVFLIFMIHSPYWLVLLTLVYYDSWWHYGIIWLCP
jgi:hypothetical protein